MAYESFISEIKKKRELSSISDSFIEDMIARKYSQINFDKLSIKDKKSIVKSLRAELRLRVGRFDSSFKSKENSILEKDLANLINLHSSSKERKEIYPQIKKLINELNPKKILDLGCGINPIFLADKSYIYFYSDINEQNLDLIKEYFRVNRFNGTGFIFDLTKIDKINSLPKADIVLLFKVLDIIGDNNHSVARYLINNLNTRYILVSFAKRTISGKKMNHPRRVWFEKIIKEMNFKVFDFKEEIFYLIDKLRKE